MAGSSWPTLQAGAIARAADVNAHFAWIEGSIVPFSGGNSTDNTFDLGTVTANWRTIYAYSINGTSTAKGLAIGTTTVANQSDVALEIAGIRSLLLPRLTTTQRTNLAGINGMIVYDSSLNSAKVYQNGAWISIGGGVKSIQHTTATFNPGITAGGGTTGSFMLSSVVGITAVTLANAYVIPRGVYVTAQDSNFGLTEQKYSVELSTTSVRVNYSARCSSGNASVTVQCPFTVVEYP